MKKTTLLILFVILSLSSVSFAQITSAGVKGLWGDAATWTGGAVPTAADDVVIAAGDSVTFSGATAACKNLTINGVLLFSKITICAVTVNGNILIATTGQFKAQTNGNPSPTGDFVNTLDLKGDLTNNGTAFDFRNGTSGTTLGVCNLTLSGTTNSTINMATTYATSNGEFNAVTINKTGGAKVILASNMYIAGGSSTGPAKANSILTFVSGIVETGTNVLVAQTSTEANVTGYSQASYVIGAMGRGMSNSSASSKTFPVGDAHSMRQFKLYSTTGGSTTGHYAIVRVVAANANTGTSTFAGGIDKVSAVRYYQIGYNKDIAGAANMSFNNFKVAYGNDDGVAGFSNNVRVAYSTDERATWTGITQTVADTVLFQTPPKQIVPDLLTTAVTINPGSWVYVALGRVTGTTDNSLEYTTTAIEQINEVPTAYTLSQNYPNPFNPATTIEFSLPKESKITLEVFDMLGRSVSVLANETRQAGTHRISFNASSLASGTYLYKLTGDGFSTVKKMLLLK